MNGGSEEKNQTPVNTLVLINFYSLYKDTIQTDTSLYYGIPIEPPEYCNTYGVKGSLGLFQIALTKFAQ